MPITSGVILFIEINEDYKFSREKYKPTFRQITSA